MKDIFYGYNLQPFTIYSQWHTLVTEDRNYENSWLQLSEYEVMKREKTKRGKVRNKTQPKKSEQIVCFFVSGFFLLQNTKLKYLFTVLNSNCENKKGTNCSYILVFLIVF